MTLVISLFVLLIFGLMLRNLFDKKKRMRRVAKNGVEAKAVLLNISEAKTNVKKQPVVRVQLQVYPKIGRNFVTELTDPHHLYLDNYRIGDSFNVKYNPVNTKEIVIMPASGSS